MKILHVNISDTIGGASRAAYRLHKALQSIGVESQMLVQNKSSDDPTVTEPHKKFRKGINKIRHYLDAFPVNSYKNKTSTFFSTAWVPYSDIVDMINESDADIVHLHWIVNGMMRIEDIGRIKKPIVWSLHDMWAFTGGCHYDSGCGKYAKCCEICPILSSNRKYDLSYRIFTRKLKIFPKIPSLTLVGMSHWITDCARSSVIFADRHTVQLPNPIDTHCFRPLNREIARELLDLPANKKLILFGAHDATEDPRKGFAEFTGAMNLIESTNVGLVFFGSGRFSHFQNFLFPVFYQGYVPGDLSLRVLYSAVDVMVIPSIQETFGQIASESMACGTPVVAFGATGLVDIVDHMQNGYLATPYDPKSLADGIDWILNYPSPRDLSNNARQKVIKNFEATKVARQYVELYNSILSKDN